MPSPTDSTWPTSVTSASWPKFWICCLRIAEISAARMSILAGLFHSKLDRIQFRAERGVDHATAHLDDEAADQVRVHLDVHVHLGLGDIAQGRLDVAQDAVGRGF